MKKYKIPLHIIFLYIVILNLNSLYAQNIDTRIGFDIPSYDNGGSSNGQVPIGDFNKSIASVIPASPQAQLFDQYLNHTIDEASGVPDIQIPLYDIHLKEITIPITLTYNASGIKYRQFDGEVGVGWNIHSTGYRISRTINGRPDDQFPMYKEDEISKYYYGGEEGSAGFARFTADKNDNSGNIDALLRQGGFGKTNLIDGEYDLYSYTLPTTKGYFVMSERNPRKFSVLGIEKDIIKDSGNMSISLTDQKGNKYSLGGVANVEEVTLSPGTITSWLLNTIQTINNESVNFKYSLIKTVSQSTDGKDATSVSILGYPEVAQASLKCGNDFLQAGVSKTPEYTKELYGEGSLFVKSIITDKEEIIFHRHTNSFYLDKIEIKDLITQNIIKTVTFEYNKSINHNQLRKITISGLGKADEVFSFDYYPSTNTASDQWGYYSKSYSAANNDVWRDVILHKELGDVEVRADRVGTITNPNNPNLDENGHYKPMEKEDETAIPRTRMTRNTSLIKAVSLIPELVSPVNLWNYDRTNKLNITPNFYSLKTITFPTGGKTEYIYEPHQYINKETNNIEGSGLRVAKIISYPSTNSMDNLVTTIYKYGKNEKGLGEINFNKALSYKYFIDEMYNYYHGCFIEFTYSLFRYQHLRMSSKTLIPEFNDFTVRYPEVTKYQVNKEGTMVNGKLTSKYEIPIKYDLDQVSSLHFDYGNEDVSSTDLGANPLLKERLYYNNLNEVIKKEVFSYIKHNPLSVSGLKVKQRVFCTEYNLPDFYEQNPIMFSIINYSISQAESLLSSKKDIIYSGNDSITRTTTYNYNDQYQTSFVKESLSDGSNKYKETSLKYPFDLKTSSPYKEMVEKNILYPLVQKNIKNNGAEVISKINYGSTNSLYLPSSEQISYSGTSGLSTEITYDKYDSKGNLLQYTGKDGISVSYLWSYKGQYPIAEIKNASYAQVQTALGIDPATISDLAQPDMSKIDALRSKLPNAMITTYTYKPLVGMLTATNPGGITTYYEYDSFNRLKQTYIIENGKKQIIEAYDYKYANQ